MGCAGAKVIEDQPKVKFTDILVTIKKEIKFLIDTNPFHEINFKNIQQVQNTSEILKKIQEIVTQYNTNEPDSETISSFLTKLIRQILKESYFKLKFLAKIENNENNPDDENEEEEEDDVQLKLWIFFLFHKFISGAQVGKKDYFKYILKNIFDRIKEENSEKNKFNKNKFFFLIISLTEMCTFWFISLFASFAVLKYQGNSLWNVKNYIEMVNKEEINLDTVRQMNKYVNDKMLLINNKMTPEYLNTLAFVEILDRIDHVYEGEKKIDLTKEEFLEFDDKDFNYILTGIFRTMHADNYSEIFFIYDTHNY